MKIIVKNFIYLVKLIWRIVAVILTVPISIPMILVHIGNGLSEWSNDNDDITPISKVITKSVNSFYNNSDDSVTLFIINYIACMVLLVISVYYILFIY